MLRSGAEAGRLHRPRNGLYVPAVALRDPYLDVAVAAEVAGRVGLLSHETAANLLRFPGHWPLSPAQVSVPRPRQPRPSPGVIVHRPRRPFDRRDVAVCHGGWRSTGVAATVITLAATSVTGDDLVSLLADLYRLRRTNPVSLAAAIERAGDGLGSRRVRRAAEELTRGYQSKAEVRFAREVSRTRMVQPEWQREVETPSGTRIVDALWGRLVVEIKGRFHQIEREVWEDDMTRENELGKLGFEVLSIPAKLALEQPAHAVAIVIDRLAHVRAP